MGVLFEGFVLIITKFRKKGGKTFEEWDCTIRNSTNRNRPAIYNMEDYNREIEKWKSSRNFNNGNSTNRYGTNQNSTNRNSSNQNRTNRNQFDYGGGDSGGASYSGCAGDTGKSSSEARLFAEHGGNMCCTDIVLNVKNNFCTQHVLPHVLSENLLCAKIVFDIQNNICTQHVLPMF